MTFIIRFQVWFAKNLSDLDREIFESSEFYEFHNFQNADEAKKEMEKIFTPLWNLEEKFPMINISSISVDGDVDTQYVCKILRNYAKTLNKQALLEIESIR